MALSLASIGSRYTQVKSDKLNPADRAYLDECRRNSANVDAEGNRLHPHPLANCKQSINPYHESFRVAQHQLLQQRLLRRASKSASWNWKRTLLLTIVLTLLLTTIIVIACVNAKEVRHGHYVRYFTMLIGCILFGSIFVVIISKLYPWITSRLCPKSPSSPEHSSSNAEELPNVIISEETNGK